MTESVTITTAVLVQDLASGDVLVQSLVDPALAVVAATAADARLELELHLAEYLPTLPPHAWARFASGGEPELRKITTKLPRADLSARLQPTTPVELSCVAIAASVGSLDRWVLLPALQLTCFVRGAEVLEEVVAAEAVRVVLARELSSADYLRLLPSPNLAVEQLTFTVGSQDGSGSFRARTLHLQRREAHELLVSVGRKLPLSPQRARPLLERSAELRLLSGLLESSERQSMLVVGEEGAGKSALLASWLDQKRDNLPAIYATSGAELMAGMSGLGEWQERLGRVLAAAELIDAILYIEDFSELTLERRGDMAGFLRTAIEQRRVRVVGELATRLVDESERRQPGLLAAMIRVVVPALTAASTRAVLDAHELFHRKTEPHRASLAPDALLALADVAGRYLPYEALPGAVLRLYDEVRGLDRVRTQSESKPLSSEDIYGWFSARSGVPLFLLREDVPLRAAELHAKLDKQLVGQDEAKRLVIDTLCIVKTRLAPLGKPLASFLFVGPTGVGKTELARSLATILFADPQRLVRFDMSEYADGDAAARLIRGRDSEEGQLTRKVREQPFCVVLLDEIEKAHPAVFDLLLQLLGEARLSDAKGRTAFFHNTIVIMTSNLGTAQRATSGFGAGEVDSDYRAAIREHFRPELVNRIDRVVAFTPLSRAQILPVVELLLAQVARRRGLVEAGATLQVSAQAIAQLAERGFSASYGARGMRRHVEQALTAPLARLCSEHAGTLDGTTVHVGVEHYDGPGHVLARLETTLHLTLIQTDSTRKRAAKLEQNLSERRRAFAAHLRLDRVSSLESEAQTLIADLAQAERRKTPMAVQMRLRARHHQLSAILDELQRAYREVCALEDLSFAAALGNEQPPSFGAELSALGKRFDAALLTALVVDETEPHELTLLVQELDLRRGLDLWLVGLLDAAGKNELRITVHPDSGDKNRWANTLSENNAREAILSDTRDFRNVLLNVRGRYAAIKLGLEAGLIHYRTSDERDPMLQVSIISRSVQLTEREYEHPSLKPQTPDRFDVLRRAKASRLFDLSSGILTIEGGRAQLECTPREHFARLDEIVLAHLLLFESDPALDRDRALTGPLVRQVFA